LSVALAIGFTRDGADLLRAAGDRGQCTQRRACPGQLGQGRITGQVRSAAFIAEVTSVIAEQLRATPDPVALRLKIGLPDSVPLLAHNDLDNYLFPLVVPPIITSV
jgi:hypothetical protein